MRRSTVCLLALAAFALGPPTTARASDFADVPAGFWAHQQINWATRYRWMVRPSSGLFNPGTAATRAEAARVLARAYSKRTGGAMATNPYTFAVSHGWLGTGRGPSDVLRQGTFDAAIVRMLGMTEVAARYGTLQLADGFRPRRPRWFGVEQIVRDLNLRTNASDDRFERTPLARMTRSALAAEAYRLDTLETFRRAYAVQEAAFVGELPAWSPLKRAVLGFALRYAGMPYVWGGTSPYAQTLFGRRVSGGFDCSGFLWWVFKRRYTVGSSTFDGTAAMANRTTYTMAANVSPSQRLAYGSLRPADVVFITSSASRGTSTPASIIDHSGIYLGAGWFIHSTSGGDGVKIDSIESGWYRNHLAFGWRVLPRGV